MNVALTLRAHEHELERLTLSELADIANSEHNAVGRALFEAVAHGIRCGEALLMAKRQLAARIEGDALGQYKVADGNRQVWDKWCDENIRFGSHYAGGYMRLAFYKDQLPPEVSLPFIGRDGKERSPSIARALNYVKGLPPIFTPRQKEVPPDERREIRELRKNGLSYRDISKLIGRSEQTVALVCDPERKRRQREAHNRWLRKRKAADRALREKTRDEAIAAAAKTTGGALAESYSVLRSKMAPALDRAISEASDAEVRDALRDALAKLYQCEDKIALALKVPLNVVKWRNARAPSDPIR
jgi:DNA-binding transcriptional MerR regulator